MSQQPGYRPIQVKENQHRKIKLLAAKYDIKITDVIERLLTNYEATASELPHPTDGQPVPIVYIEKQEGK